MENSKVWFITGASKGLGLSLAKQLLKKGQKVAATSRNIKGLTTAIGDNYSSSFLPLEGNFTNEHLLKNQ